MAWELLPPAGICSEAPAGQVVEGAADADDEPPTSAAETLTPESATVPMAAASMPQVRPRHRPSFAILTQSSSTIVTERTVRCQQPKDGGLPRR